VVVKKKKKKKKGLHVYCSLLPKKQLVFWYIVIRHVLYTVCLKKTIHLTFDHHFG